MASLKEYLLSHIDAIGCTACGNCCPNYCGNKEDNLCKAHPSLDNKLYRGVNCNNPPLFMALEMGVACPAVIKVVQEKTDVTPLTEKDPKNGVTFFKGTLFSPGGFIYPNELNRLLESEI